MEEVIAFVFQILIEVVLQLFGSVGLDFASSRRDQKDEGGCGWLGVFALFGGVCGGLSLLVFPNALLPNVGLRVANLIAAPLLAGGISALASGLWSDRGANPAHHFWRGFWFALLFGIVRFAYISR